MGSGCQNAKDSSDLVILDNSFVSIYKSIKWGRQIFDNVRKFLQFQLTINILIVTFVFLHGLMFGQSPLNVIQFLWLNLIMDILGAIAICTEPPQVHKVSVSEGSEHSSVKTTRISRKDRIILPLMWRNILGQVAYQLLVLLILACFGTFMFFEHSFNVVTEPLRNANGIPSERMALNTIVFHTLILMNLFNQINCRVVAEKELNVFKTLFNNKFFWIVFLIELGVQNYMMFASSSPLVSALLGTAELTTGQIITCYCLGVSTLIVYPIIQFIPLDLFKKVVEKIDLETEEAEDNFANKILNNYKERIDKITTQVTIT